MLDYIDTISLESLKKNDPALYKDFQEILKTNEAMCPKKKGTR